MKKVLTVTSIVSAMAALALITACQTSGTGQDGAAIQCLQVTFEYGSDASATFHSERDLAGSGCSTMETRTQYLEFAEECDRLAKQAETDRQRMA